MKTRAEYIELAEHFAAVGTASTSEEIAYNSMLLQRAQVYATLALAAPIEPQPDASVELLSALKGMVHSVDYDSGSDDFSLILHDARVAISRAEQAGTP
jgi:hypothetical protein